MATGNPRIRSKSSANSAWCSGSSLSSASRRRASSSAKITSRVSAMRSGAPNIRSVRQRPIPSAPDARAILASARVSASARTRMRRAASAHSRTRARPADSAGGAVGSTTVSATRPGSSTCRVSAADAIAAVAPSVGGAAIVGDAGAAAGCSSLSPLASILSRASSRVTSPASARSTAILSEARAPRLPLRACSSHSFPLSTAKSIACMSRKARSTAAENLPRSANSAGIAASSDGPSAPAAIRTASVRSCGARSRRARSVP